MSQIPSNNEILAVLDKPRTVGSVLKRLHLEATMYDVVKGQLTALSDAGLARKQNAPGCKHTYIWVRLQPVQAPPGGM